MSRRQALGLFTAGAAAAVVGGGACSSGDARTAEPVEPAEPEEPDEYWPPDGGDWERVTPAAAGWDGDKLDAALTFAAERESRAMVVLLDGRILAEGRWDAPAGYARDIASCQKSVVSLLVGGAVARGVLDLDDPVTAHLGRGWSKAAPADEDRVLVRHLVTMTSGLDGAFGVAAEPGSVWRYDNNAYHLLQPVLERTAGAPIEEITREWLWRPIAVADSQWYERPGEGPDRVDPMGRRLWGLVMPARDMARFGLLVQRGGRWAEGNVDLAPGYLDAALAPSSELNPSYGYLWWLNGRDGHVLPRSTALRPGPLIPGAPDDLVAALGADDQKIYVSRSRGLVVTRLGDRAGARTAALSDFDRTLWEKLLAAAPT